MDYGVGSLTTSRDAGLYVRDKSASANHARSASDPSICFVSDSALPVISNVEALQDDDNESNYEGSDKELKYAWNILDEPETEPLLAFTAITSVFEILLGKPPNGSVSEIKENVQTVEDEEITAVDLRRMVFFLGHIFEEIISNLKDPKSF